MIKLFAYAKVNLALEVKEKVNGYHLVNNLMVPIDLYDEVILEESNELVIESSIDIKNNICLLAYNEFVRETGISNGVKITLKKNIPLEAGLAGGSTDAAAVLKGLNKLFNTNLSNTKLENMAKNIGSDVPFFINPGLSLCINRGEVVKHLDINFNDIDIFIVKPKIGLSTKMIYENYHYKNDDKMYKINNIIESLKNNDIKKLKDNIFNDLANVALNVSHEFQDLYNRIRINNDVYISGSGPSMFILDYKNDVIFDEKIFVKKCKILGGKIS